jgi:hypothetical protein
MAKRTLNAGDQKASRALKAVSTSPAPVQPQVMLTWDGACKAALAGKRLTRLAWGNPDFSIGMKGEHLSIRKPDGTDHNLIVAEGDMTATDWVVLLG